jgi:hypothetical protein
MEILSGVVVHLVIDGLTSAFLLIGGAVLATQVRNVSCGDWLVIMLNKVLNCGAQSFYVEVALIFSNYCVDGTKARNGSLEKRF